MKATCLSGIRRWDLVVWLALSWLAPTMAAQFVEITTEIEGTYWPDRGAESRRIYSVRFIVGTNRWMIEGEFLSNGTTTYWSTDTNLIKHIVITKKPPEPSSQNKGGVISKMPEVGERFTSVYSISNGGPTFDDGYENVFWLVYCSGTYLKQRAQRIPLPIGGKPRAQYAQNYSQTTSLFEDELALPKSVELLTPDKHLLCRYDVQQSTNVAGWMLPQRFKLTQYRPSPNGVWGPHAEAVGKLTSVRNTNEPRIPEEVLSQIRQ